MCTFADADFAGCPKTSRSTRGVHLSLLGPNSVWPLPGQSKKQTAVSHSTPESEIIAADHAVRQTGIPATGLWRTLFGRQCLTTTSHEDNETAIVAIRQGWSSAMRHLKRTHGVCLRSLAEHFRRSNFELVYERSALQSADVYTKAFTDSVDWCRAQKLINHLDPKIFWGGRSQCGSGPLPQEHKGGVQYDYWTSCPWFAQPSAVETQCGSSHAASALPKLNDIIDDHDDEFHDFFDDSIYMHLADYADIP